MPLPSRSRLLPAILLLLLAALAAFHFSRPVKRVRRATVRLLRAASKETPGPEAPLDLLRSVAPFRKSLDPACVAVVPETLSIRGRSEILQAYRLLRQMADVILVDAPTRLNAVSVSPDAILLRLEVPFKIQFATPDGSWADDFPWSPTLIATLLWNHTPDGWLLTQATLDPFLSASTPHP